MTQYNLANIRKMFKGCFSAQELRNFCFDMDEFQPVYETFAENTDKTVIIQKILEHAKTRSLFEILLNWAKENNPECYTLHEPYHSTGYISEKINELEQVDTAIAQPDVEVEIKELEQQPEKSELDQITSSVPHSREEIYDREPRKSELQAEPEQVQKNKSEPINRRWKIVLWKIILALTVLLLFVMIITILLFSNRYNSGSVCPNNSDDVFEQVLMQDAELARILGGLKAKPTSIQGAAYLSFERGFMIFEPIAKKIYVLFSDETRWKTFEDTWTIKKPQFSCDENPPDGRFQPAWGFGKVWCENKEVKNGLGLATMQEETQVDLLLQSYDEGWLIFLDNNIYALVNSNGSISGTWKKIPIYNYEYETIPLKLLSELSSPETNLGLKPDNCYYLPKSDLQTASLGDSIPFETGWKVSTQCYQFDEGTQLDERPTRIHLDRDMDIQNPVSVYLLLQAGWGLKQYKDKQIGEVHLNFSDGRIFITPLILGSNIRDWASKRDNAVTTVFTSTVKLAWQGPAPDATPGRMDILQIDIPDDYSGLALTSIEVLDVSKSKIGNVDRDPCIHLLGVTVKYLPEHQLPFWQFLKNYAPF